MNIQTLTIEIPKGYEVETFDKEKGELKFREKPKSVMERINTIEDVLEDHGISMEEIDQMFNNVPEHLKWQYIAEKMCESFNEGWKPNWNDSNERKYYPWFEMGSSGFRFDGCGHWGTHSSVGSRLCFKSSELAKHAATISTYLYEKFMLIK